MNIKKIFLSAVYVVVIFSLLTIGQLKFTPDKTLRAHALEVIDPNGEVKTTLNVNKTSALADGKDKIKITFGSFWIKDLSSGGEPYLPSKGASPASPKPRCGNYDDGILKYEFEYFNIKGSLNYVDDGHSTISLFLGYSVTAKDERLYEIRNIFSCSTGYATVYLSSTKAETKSIDIYTIYGKGSGEATIGYSRFSTPIYVTFKTPTNITPTPTPATSLSLTSQTRLTSGKSQTITGNSSTIYPTDKLTLTGTASPNAKITLTIHSTPVTADVTADASGNWTYTLDPKVLKLTNGSHTVTAIATSTNGTKSDEITLATFTLKSPPTVTTETTESPNYFTTINIALFGAAVILLAALIFLLIKRHKKTAQNSSSNLEIPPTP